MLAATYPVAVPKQRDGADFAVLVETVLASQSSDDGVRRALPALLDRYPDVRRLAGADVEQVASLISAIPLQSQKAQNLVRMAEMICSQHRGEIPTNLDDLVRLPGVGRRIAQTFLASTNRAATLPMSTHTHRVALRLGWTRSENAVHAEADMLRQLHEHVRPDEFERVTLQISAHARSVCTSSRPRCGDCNLFELCPSAGTGA